MKKKSSIFIKELFLKDFMGFTGYVVFKQEEPNILIGCNGAGKTTVLRILNALTHPNPYTPILDVTSFGNITVVAEVDGEDIREEFEGPQIDQDQLRQFRDKFPDPAQFAFDNDQYLTVDDNFWEGLGYQKVVAISHCLGKLGIDVHPKLMNSLGNGAVTICQIYNGVNPDETGPLLMDHPERSLHIMIKRKLLDIIMDDEFLCNRRTRQLVVTAHDPSFIENALGYRNSERDTGYNIIDLDLHMHFSDIEQAQLHYLEKLME